jgi:hypothetical protein
MQSSRLVFLLVLLTFAKTALAQQATASAPQATALLQQALSALTGGQPLNDVTLSGTARRIAGSDDESGTAVLKGLAAGASRVDLSLSSGQHSEIRNLSTALPAGSWSGPDAIAHRIADHNLMLIDPAWFFPLFPISRGLTAGYAATYIGQETRNGKAVQHIAIAETSGVPSPSGSPSLAHLSQMDFFLDAATLLPAAATFNIHPDNDAGRDFPIEVQFSDYRNVNGVQIPFHVQKFLNNGLILDLQFSSAAVNTGLSPTEFAVSAQQIGGGK